MELVTACYQCWFEEPLKNFLAKRHLPKSDPDYSDDVKEFAHFVARLGAHKYAAFKVAEGIDKLPILPISATVSSSTGCPRVVTRKL